MNVTHSMSFSILVSGNIETKIFLSKVSRLILEPLISSVRRKEAVYLLIFLVNLRSLRAVF